MIYSALTAVLFLAVIAVGLQPEMTVLDACAAPGGKSLHLAEKLWGKGKVISRDLTESAWI